MAYLLHIESATTNCSVAISYKGSIISSKELNAKQFSHAENLHAFVDDVALQAGISLKQLDGVSVSKGPGSYTGLRIGVSAAKGFAFGLQIPLFSVNTLAALAHQLHIKKGMIVCMLDARRMEAYTQTFSFDYTPLNAIEAKVLEEDSFKKLLDENEVHFVGSAAEKFQTICQHANANFHPELLPSAKEQAKLAYQKFIHNEIEDTAYFEPFYLKDFVAGKPKSTKI